MRIVHALLVALLSACASHRELRANTGSADPGAGAAASIYVEAGPLLGVLVGLGFVAAAVESDAEHAARLIPQLDPGRRVQEHDCRQPITEGGANLRCR
jgi:hypothetical protein